MKLRTNKTASKRIRATGKGTLQATTTSAQHLRHNKSKRQLAAAKRYQLLSKGDSKRMAKLLPYL